MNKLLHLASAIIAIICMSSCISVIIEMEVGPYTVSTIEKNVYHIQDYNSANPAGEAFDSEGNKTHFNNCSDMYLIVGKKEALLIDLSNNIRWADNAAESLRQIIAERTEGKPLTITFTHNHGDHTGMMGAYVNDPDVDFALPEKDFTRMASRFPEGQYSFINEGHTFDLGGIEIETIYVPGHTDGSMVFYMPKHDILFSGDAIGSGHGVWIFNTANYIKYAEAVPHLISWLENPQNGVDTDRMRIYGGHYWQRDWLPELGDEEMGMQYIEDMQTLLDEIEAGTAATEPSDLGRQGLDTYFRHGSAIIVWSEEQAHAYRTEKTEF